MESTTNERDPNGLAQALVDVLEAGGTNGPSIRMITKNVKEKGFGLLLMILSLPSALPVPAPGYSTPFGLVIGFVAIQMILGRKEIWLPEKLGKKPIKPEVANKMIGASVGFIRKIEHFIRPRQKWMRSKLGQIALASVIIIMACLMILPIPLTNTFPAMVIFLVGISLTEEDGLLAIFGLSIGFLTVFLYIGIIYLLVTQGPEAIDALKESIKSILGLA